MFTVSLSCHHQRRFKQHPPPKGEIIWCFRCADFKSVTHLIGPWRAECHQCPMRIAGDTGNRVIDAATEHAEQYGHTVSFWKSGAHPSRQLITPDTRGQGLLPIDAQEA